MRNFRLAPILLAILVAAAPGVAGAQSMQPGLVAGVSFATLTGDLVEGADNYTTFLAGGFLRFDMSGVTVEPGLVYTNKGAKSEIEDGLTATNKISYLQVPVLIKVGFPIGAGGTRLYLGAGPAIGFKISCKFKASGAGFSASTDCEDLEDGEDNGLEAKSTEFSGIGVAGVEFGKFGIGVRADFGLTNVYEAATSGVSVEPDVKTRTISLVGSIRL